MTILYFLLNLTPTIQKGPSEQVIQAISATLFYKKKVEPLQVRKSLVDRKEKTHTESLDIENEKIEETDYSMTHEIEESIQPKSDVVEKVVSSNVNKVNSFESLQALRKKIIEQTYQQSEEQAYRDFVARKNIIPRSTTKFNQLPQAQPVKVEINCDNTFNKGLTILSGLLGGSVNCNRFNGSQKYIDTRLEKLGKKKKTKSG